MAFDGVARAELLTLPRQSARAEVWRRDERLAVLVGAAAFGALAGFAGTLWAGRMDAFVLVLIAAPILALDLHLTGQTLSEALRRNAHGCASACVLHGVAVLAWPVTALVAAFAPVAFWVAPALAMTALLLFASCWGGQARAIYRMGGQSALVAALVAQQGLFALLGG